MHVFFFSFHTNSIRYLLISVHLIRYFTDKKAKKLWVRSWIQRRNQLGISNIILKKLAIEHAPSYFNFLRIS